MHKFVTKMFTKKLDVTTIFTIALFTTGSNHGYVVKMGVVNMGPAT